MFLSMRRFWIQFMNVICNVFNRPRSVSTWMNVHKRGKRLRELCRTGGVRLTWRQLNVRRAKCFANKDRVAPLSVDIRTHTTSLLFPRIKFVFIQTDRYSKAINSQFVIMRTIIQPSFSKSKQTGLTCTILVHVADIRQQLVRFRPKWANVLQYHRRQRRSTAFQFLPDTPFFSPSVHLSLSITMATITMCAGTTV